MPKLQTRLEIVQGIPVDQKARATIDIKRYWLSKLKGIQENRNIIEQSKQKAERDKVLNGYKKAVGFDKIADRLVKAKKEAQTMEETLLKLGLTEEGTLLEVCDKNNYREHGPFVRDHRTNHYIMISPGEAENIRKVHDLLKAVHAEWNIFSIFDQLEARMMMASTVGECMAIVNAVADRDVFAVKPEVLKLKENGEGDN